MIRYSYNSFPASQDRIKGNSQILSTISPFRGSVKTDKTASLLLGNAFVFASNNSTFHDPACMGNTCDNSTTGVHTYNGQDIKVSAVDNSGNSLCFHLMPTKDIFVPTKYGYEVESFLKWAWGPGFSIAMPSCCPGFSCDQPNSCSGNQILNGLTVTIAGSTASGATAIGTCPSGYNGSPQYSVI